MHASVASVPGDKLRRCSHRRLCSVATLIGNVCLANLTGDMHYRHSGRRPRLQLRQQPEPPLQSLCILFISLVRFQLCFPSLFIVSLLPFDFNQISSMFSLNSACFHKHMLRVTSSHCMVLFRHFVSRLHFI